jgi:chromosome partitioning protein
MPRRIAVASLKGGVAKTTTSACLAVGLSRRLRRGKRLLLIDADSQANLSHTMADAGPMTGPTLADVILDGTDINDAIRPSRVSGIDLLPAMADLADATMELTREVGREQRLRNALETVADRYEWVVIDCPPRLDLLTVNALNSVSEVLIPADAGVYAALGLSRLQATVAEIRRHLRNDPLHVIGLLITRAMKNRPTAEIEAQLRDHYKELVFKTVIPYSVAVEEAHAVRRTVLERSPKSPAAVAYDRLIAEVLRHGAKPTRRANRRHNAA